VRKRLKLLTLVNLSRYFLPTDMAKVAIQVQY